jgi:hypothetical protein
MNANTPAAGPQMDLAFIARHQVVERYLAGKLPRRAAQDFEQFCQRHPQLLDEIGLSDRVNAALRLLEAGGKPEPWVEAPVRFYQRPLVFLGVSLLALALAVTTALLWDSRARAFGQRVALQKQLTEQPLRPTASTRPITLELSRTAPSSRSMATLHNGVAELADLKINVAFSRYTNFRILIDRVEQGRFAVLGNVQRDSNGQLRLAFNATALGPGDYQLTVEGLDWRGNAEPQGWVRITVVR